MMKGSWIRLVALCVAQVFMCSSFSAYAAPVRGDIPRTSPGISVQAKAAPSIDSIRIDPRFGRIVESQTFENSPYTIVHIQDLHAHAEAQENIARILHSLYKEYGIRQVALEGSEGPVYSFFFSTFPDDEVRVRWAEQALDQAVITGPEKVAIADQLPLELYGVEDRAEYVRDFLFFQQVHTAPEEARAEFRQALGQLEILEQEVYPEVVKTKLALFSRKAEGSSPSSGLFAELIESSRELQIPLAESYPSLEAYSGMQELEGSLDEESFQKQLKQLVTQLSQSEAAPAVRQELLQLVSQVSGGQTGAGAFAGKLVGLVERAQLPIDSYPAVYAMAEHEALSMRVRPESLLAEVDRLQEKILQRLFETEDQRQVHELRKGARILEKVVSAEASPKDWQEFRTLSSDASLGALCKSLREFLKKYQVGSGSEVPKKPCKEWAGLIKASEGFYEVGEKRNESLVANTLAFLQRSGAQTGVLLTGGFHTKGMTELLAQRGISYVVVAPRVTQFAG
ncbi:MAG: hypothetical protein JW937_03865, partial [Candidatus Omnitrophica bacterium]|nr:hypothetical protein [Candidatus Omnitrophota bacterium]